MGIYYKVKLDKLPENCNRCPLHWCRLPCKLGVYEFVLKKKYMTQRHEDCPLEVKED